jgi:integrase
VSGKTKANDGNVPTFLTDTAVQKYKPTRERRIIRDLGARSLYLVIHPSGNKSWMMRFRRSDGKPGKLVLGPLHSGKEVPGELVTGMPLTLAAARQRAAEVHRERKLGHDPVADHKARRHRQRTGIEERAASTFAAAAVAYIDEYARPETRNWLETARLLGLRYPKNEPEKAKGGLAQRWADKPVASIDSDDIFSAVDEARRVGIPGITVRSRSISDARGRALFAALSGMFSWLKRQRRVKSNPCAGVDRPAGPEARDRVLTADEIRWFWRACENVDAPLASGAPRPFGPLLKVLLLTGQRRNEVAGMTRDELSEDGATWNIPGSRTKNGRAHIVPLAPLVRELIASVSGKPGKFVFTTTGRTHVSGWSRTKARLDAAMLAIARQERGEDAAIPPWRLHDLRRSAVTGMVELGVAPHVVELAVNHISGTRAGVAGIYNRSEMLPKRKEALDRWAAHIAGLVSGREAKIVSMRR